jgi:hypothetical protein
MKNSQKWKQSFGVDSNPKRITVCHIRRGTDSFAPDPVRAKADSETAGEMADHCTF